MVAEQIQQKIKNAKNNTVFFSNSFPEYDDEYVGKVLSSLVKEGKLFRLSRGVYVKAVMTRFGPVYPASYEIAKAIAKRDHAEVLPTGAEALNVLGLSTQVPMKAVYLTSGTPRMLSYGGMTIKFLHVAPKNFSIKGNYRRLIVQAMKYLGENGMDEEVLTKIKTLILQHPESETLEHDMKVVPQWIKKIYVQTIKESHNE